MIHVQRRGAVVSLVLPDGHITEPAIYIIEIPTEDGRPLSDDTALAKIIGDIWIAVGGSIVVARVVRVPDDPDEPTELLPLRNVSTATANSSPIRLNSAILDPHHFDYEEFHKYYSHAADNIVWELHIHALQRRHGYLLRQDGSLLPYSNIYDHIAPMSGHHQPTGLHNGTDADDLHSKNMGIDPMVTVGAMPYEEEPQAEVQKKPGSRARSAGNKVKIEAMASSPIKAPSSRKGRPPPALTKTSASTIPKRAASPRKPASRSASPKKATTTKPVSASASTSASLATPFPTNRPAGPAPFQGQPYFSAASSSVQASPVRLTRSATREGTMTLPPITPPLPERRMASSRTAGAQPTPAGCQVPTSSQTAADPRPLPAYVAPTPQPIPGPSSARMEYVPTAEYPAGHSNFESGFAQTLHQWPMPMLVPAAWTQHQPYPGPANGRAMEE